MPPSAESSPAFSKRQSILIFFCFASAYFFSYGLRSVNASLAPYITHDLGLSISQLGWLSSAFFISLAALQTPLGVWLDRYGARRVEAILLLVAASGAILLAYAETFAWVTVGRVLIGGGISACLMAPFSYFRRCFAPERQGQLALWLLVAGTSGAAVFTSPAAAMADALGWRSVYLASGIMFALIALLLMRVVPDRDVSTLAPSHAPARISLRSLAMHPDMLRVVPISLIGQGGIIALQTLWAGPWMTDVLGMNTQESAHALLVMMTSMMFAYIGMSLISPPLQRRFGMWRVGMSGYWFCIATLFLIVAFPTRDAWVLWPVMALGIAPIMLVQPSLGLLFPKDVAGRVITLYNMFVFIGAFIVQWAVGFAIELMTRHGADTRTAFTTALGVLAVLQLAALLWSLKPRGRAA